MNNSLVVGKVNLKFEKDAETLRYKRSSKHRALDIANSKYVSPDGSEKNKPTKVLLKDAQEIYLWMLKEVK